MATYCIQSRRHFGSKCYSIHSSLVMGDTIDKVSKSSILTKVSILSILAKSIGNSIPLEPAMFLVSIPDQSLNISRRKQTEGKNVDMMLFLNKNM